MSIYPPLPTGDIATWYDEAQTACMARQFDAAQTSIDRILAQDANHVEPSTCAA
jgi:hypothetical protein